MTPRRAALTCFGSALAATFLMIGAAELPLPPLATPGSIREWWLDNGPAPATFGMLRLIGLVLSGYLSTLGLIGWLSATTRSQRVLRILEIMARPAGRRVVVGGSLAAALSIPAVVSAEPGSEIRVIDIGPAPERPSPRPDEPPAPSTPAPEPAEPPAPTTPAPEPSEPLLDPPLDPPRLEWLDESDRPPADRPPAEPTDVWVVAPGDHLWAIAQETLLDHGDDPSEGAVATYWLRVIEANRDGVGDNPDLVHPGQHIRLPAIHHGGAAINADPTTRATGCS